MNQPPLTDEELTNLRDIIYSYRCHCGRGFEQGARENGNCYYGHRLQPKQDVIVHAVVSEVADKLKSSLK